MSKNKKQHIDIEKEREEMGVIIRNIGSRTRLMFTCAMMTDILVNSINNSLNYMHSNFSQERKKAFKEYVSSIETCLNKYETCADSVLWGDGIQSCEQYRQNANELLRAVMYYMNSVNTEREFNYVMDFLKSRSDMNECKMFKDEEINRFNFVRNK